MDVTASGEGVPVIIERLLQTLEAENAALAGQAVHQHSTFAEVKNHALRELMALGRRGVPLSSRGVLAKRFATLRKSLAANGQLLDFHIRALREVSAVIIDCIQNSESDGTYGIQRRGGRPPQC